jgi:SAM-dependent methyltransferase
VSTIESDYYSFMNFDMDRAREAQAFYAPFFSGPVLELACGRGEFLDVLRDAGVEARGVDLDEGMVASCAERGHEVVFGDALEYLAQSNAGSYGGVFAAHFAEHLQPDDVLAMCRSAHRALRPGGRLVLVVPNAASHSVMSYDFWRDPTHVRFYDPLLLRFFCEQAGFTVEESGGNPRNDPGPPPELYPVLAPQTHPTLSDEIGAAVRAARKETDLANGLGHLLSVVAERLRMAEETIADLRAAHDRLLKAFYPPSEVYVVARA